MATKYQEIAATIRKQIEDGSYQTGDLLPDQSTLAAQFAVNRLTVKKALDGLAKEGLIYKQSGLGTYVRGKIPFVNQETDIAVDDVRGGYEEYGEHITSKVISLDVLLPDEFMQQTLNLKRIDPVYEVKRIRYIDGEPVFFEHTYLPVKLVPELSEEICEKSLYEYMRKQKGIKLGNAFRKFSALAASTEDAEFLAVKKGTPILEIEQVIWMTNGRAAEYSINHVAGDKRSYTVMNVTNLGHN